MKCKHCQEEKPLRVSYRERNGQVNRELVCEECHALSTEEIIRRYENDKSIR